MKMSLTAIRAFDALVRMGSFKTAAESLNVTPTAISHQIRQLEAQLQLQLFTRSTRRVTLTPEGESLSREVCPALHTIRHAIDKRLNQSTIKTVSVGISALFASRWLIPRLSDFLAANPDIDLALHHSVLPVWQQAERYDLCIDWGDGRWEGLEASRLYSVQFSPVATPDMAKRLGPSPDPVCLLDQPLLHHRSTSAWQNWFDAHGVETGNTIRGLVLEDANVELQAATEGKGISLGVFPFIETEVRLGKLVRLFETFSDPDEGYYLIEGRAGYVEPHVLTARKWLIETAAAANVAT